MKIDRQTFVLVRDAWREFVQCDAHLAKAIRNVNTFSMHFTSPIYEQDQINIYSHVKGELPVILYDESQDKTGFDLTLILF